MSGQSATMLAALRTGARTAVELNRMGVGRPNSRAADLRKHGHTIVCDFDKQQKGAARYVYRLLSETSVDSTPALASLSSTPGRVSPTVEPRTPEVPVACCSPCAGGPRGDKEPANVPDCLPVVCSAEGRSEPNTALRQLSLLGAA